MRKMGIQAIAPGPGTSTPRKEHTIYPYLLRDMSITEPLQVWCSDITYIPMQKGFMYLVAILDWHSRYVVSWSVSNTMETSFCIEALDTALAVATPGIFNTDQGAQFTSDAFTGRLLEAGVRVSMDGRGRVIDNIMIERLWRSLKYEDIYLRSYEDGLALRAGLAAYFNYYNHHRFHQSLDYLTPAQVHYGLC